MSENHKSRSKLCIITKPIKISYRNAQTLPETYLNPIQALAQSLTKNLPKPCPNPCLNLCPNLCPNLA